MNAYSEDLRKKILQSLRRGQMPYLLSIGERAESIAEAFEQRLITVPRRRGWWGWSTTC